MTDPTIPDAAVEAYRQAHAETELAITCSVSVETMDVARESIRAGLEAAYPHIAAAVLHAYADREHPADSDAGYCSGCGYAFIESEGGCTERTTLLQAAAALAGTPVPADTPPSIVKIHTEVRKGEGSIGEAVVRHFREQDRRAPRLNPVRPLLGEACDECSVVCQSATLVTTEDEHDRGVIALEREPCGHVYRTRVLVDEPVHTERWVYQSGEVVVDPRRAAAVGCPYCRVGLAEVCPTHAGTDQAVSG